MGFVIRGSEVQGTQLVRIGTAVVLGYGVYSYLSWLRKRRHYNRVLKDIPRVGALKRWRWPFSDCVIIPRDDFKEYGNEAWMDTITKYTAGVHDVNGVSGITKVKAIPTRCDHLLIITNRTVMEKELKSPQGTFRIKTVDRQVFGNTVISTNGQEWKDRRRIMAKSFHTDMLVDYHDILNSQCVTMVKYLDSKTHPGNFTAIEFRKLGAAIAMDIAGEILFGQSLDTQQLLIQTDELPEWVTLLYVDWSKGVADAYNSFQWWIFKWLRPADYKSFTNATKDFKSRMVALAANRKKLISDDPDTTLGKFNKLCIIDSILKLNTAGLLSDEDMASELVLFFGAGADTSQIVLCDGLAHLAMPENASVVQKLQSEIDEKYPDGANMFVDRGDLEHMQYLDAVVQEMLRIATPFPWVARHLVQPVKVSKDVTIEASHDWPVAALLSMESMNKDKTVWGDDVERFRPERHFEERPGVSVASFSYGPRNCIGKHLALSSLKVEMIYLMKHFDVQCRENLVEKPKEYLRTSLARRFAVEPVINFKNRDLS